MATGSRKISLKNIPRSDFEYPTKDVSFAYLAIIDKFKCVTGNIPNSMFLGTYDYFTDKAVQSVLFVGGASGTDGYSKVCLGARVINYKNYTSYLLGIKTQAATADFGIVKYVNGVSSLLGTEAVNIYPGNEFMIKFIVSGSTLKGYRTDLSVPKITVVDTDIEAGMFGASATATYYNDPPDGYMLLGRLLDPSSRLPPSKLLLEVEVTGEGTDEDPIRPVLVSKLKETEEYKKLKKHEELLELLGISVKKHIDLMRVTYGAFDFKHGDSTMLISVTGGNPYSGDKAILDQKRKAVRAIKPPRNLQEAREIHRELKKGRDLIAGVHCLAYITIGDENIEPLSVADYYDGYNNGVYDRKLLDKVPQHELERIIGLWADRLSKAKVNADEKNKHMVKLKKFLKA